MPEIREIASGLQFPEGPIAMPDGSVILVEGKRGTRTRVQPNGKIEVIAETGGGPNGAAIGPDGKVYVCNDGGFEWHEMNGLLIPGHQPHDYSGGRIERVDLGTGKVEVLYTECDGHPFRGPNDLVFDRTGGFWFTDHGKVRERDRDRTGVYYAKPDGSMVREVVFPIDSPNGVGLSPDEKKLYVAETWTARVWQWDVPTPGQITAGDQPFTPGGGTLLTGLPGFQLLDSLAVDSAGTVCVATIINGGITAISPDGKKVDHVPLPDPLTTNVCFGGPDLTTAYATLSGTGRLVSFPWPRPGLRLNFC
jgi:gluconolactonase